MHCNSKCTVIKQVSSFNTSVSKKTKIGTNEFCSYNFSSDLLSAVTSEGYGSRAVFIWRGIWELCGLLHPCQVQQFLWGLAKGVKEVSAGNQGAGSCPVQVTKANKIWTKLSKAEAWPPPLIGSKKARSIQPLWPPNHRLNPSQSSLTIMACGNERGDVIWFTLCHLKSSCVASASEVFTASSLFSSSSGMPRWHYAWAFDGLRWAKADSVDKTPG